MCFVPVPEATPTEAVSPNRGKSPRVLGVFTRLILTAMAVVAFASVGASVAQGEPRAEVGNRPGDEAPGFALKRLNGEGVVRLEEFLGEVVILNFFAASCPSCLKDLPVFQQAYEDLADRGVSVVGIGILDDYQTLSELVADMNLTYPSAYDGDNDVARAYGLRSMPTTVFIGRDGIIQEVRTRALTEEQIREIVEPLL